MVYFKLHYIPNFRHFQNLVKCPLRVFHSNYTPRVTKSFQSSPSLLLITEKRKTNFSSILIDYGFSHGQVERIINSSPSILELNEKDLHANLATWYLFEANSKFFAAFSSNPELLTLNPEYVNNRIQELMTLFTKKDINKLLYTCSKVFVDDFETLMKKLQYIVHNMGVEQKSIVKTYALQFSLNHIKCRHNFMSRAGCYKVQKKSLKSKIPPLHKVFSRNLETFLKLTNLSSEEYLVFCDAYEEELYLESLDEDSDDEL